MRCLCIQQHLHIRRKNRNTQCDEPIARRFLRDAPKQAHATGDFANAADQHQQLRPRYPPRHDVAVVLRKQEVKQPGCREKYREE
jgi:hypothetical protein